MTREAGTFREKVIRAKQATPVVTGKPGPNVKLAVGWRERLMAYIPASATLRSVAERAILPDGHAMMHSTVRSMLLSQGNASLLSVIALCDAVGADVTYILTGRAALTAKLPPGGPVPANLNATALPIVSMDNASNWKEVAMDPSRYEEIFLATGKGADSLMVAYVTDDSMSPDYVPGDVITYREGAPTAGRPAIVEVEGAGISVMRLWKPAAGDKVRLQAINEDYGSQIMAEKRIKFVAAVVGLARDIT